MTFPSFKPTKNVIVHCLLVVTSLNRHPHFSVTHSLLLSLFFTLLNKCYVQKCSLFRVVCSMIAGRCSRSYCVICRTRGACECELAAAMDASHHSHCASCIMYLSCPTDRPTLFSFERIVVVVKWHLLQIAGQLVGGV